MPVSAWMIDAIDPQPGQSLLELAAGTGDTGLLAAELIAPTGTLISSDFAPEMLQAAQRRAEELGIANVRFKQIDADTSIDLEAGSLDGVLCRWGYMLMADPENALRETRRVLRPGGRVALAAWAAPEANPWQSLPGREAIAAGLAEAPDPDLPGPFRWAREGADRRAARERPASPSTTSSRSTSRSTSARRPTGGPRRSRARTASRRRSTARPTTSSTGSPSGSTSTRRGSARRTGRCGSRRGPGSPGRRPRSDAAKRSSSSGQPWPEFIAASYSAAPSPWREKCRWTTVTRVPSPSGAKRTSTRLARAGSGCGSRCGADLPREGDPLRRLARHHAAPVAAEPVRPGLEAVTALARLDPDLLQHPLRPRVLGRPPARSCAP